MTNKNKCSYIDYQGKPLPNHDGSSILVSDKDGYQFFGVDGKGFLHDGTVVQLKNGTKQFFLNDGKAIIHDGSPIELPNGLMQYFDHEGRPMWPVDEKRLTPLINQQRDIFFKEMLKKVNKETPLTESETEDLRLAFLAAEHPDSEENQILSWDRDSHCTKIEPICPETAGVVLTLEILWPRVWRKYQLRHREVLSARFILNQIKKHEKCPLASLKASELMLVNELSLEFKRAEKFIIVPEDTAELEKIGLSDKGVFQLDELLVKYVKQMRKGKGTEQFSTQFRAAYKSKDFDVESRIEAWKNPLFMYRCIAQIIWLNSVKDQAECAYRKPPALPLIVSDTINEIVKIGTRFDESTGRILDRSGREFATVNKKDLNHIPSISMKALERILSPQNIRALSSLNYLRLVSWEVITGMTQVVKQQSDARLISVSGGYQEIAHLIGAGKGGKACDQVKEILAWQAAPQRYIFHDRYGNEKIIVEGNMISFERIHNGTKSSAINIVLGTMLLPHSFFKLLKSQSKFLSSEATMLIPLPNGEPNLIGKANTFASQVSFQWNFLAEARKKAKEMVKNGCIYMPPDKMAQLAQKSDLSTPFHLRVIDAWLKDGEKPAFLHLVEKDHYALGPASKQIQDFIVEGGKRELALSTAGKLSAKRKSAGIFSKK
jgi:hypothetical protein